MMRVIGDCSQCRFWGYAPTEGMEPHDRARVLREAENPLMRYHPITYQTLPNESPEIRRCGHPSVTAAIPEDNAGAVTEAVGAMIFSPTATDTDARLCTTGGFGCAHWENVAMYEPEDAT